MGRFLWCVRIIFAESVVFRTLRCFLVRNFTRCFVNEKNPNELRLLFCPYFHDFSWILILLSFNHRQSSNDCLLFGKERSEGLRFHSDTTGGRQKKKKKGRTGEKELSGARAAAALDSRDRRGELKETPASRHELDPRQLEENVRLSRPSIRWKTSFR